MIWYREHDSETQLDVVYKIETNIARNFESPKQSSEYFLSGIQKMMDKQTKKDFVR